MATQTNTRIPRLGSLGLLPRVGASSLFESIGEVRPFFRAVSIVIGISASSPSALADVEEAGSQDESVSDYSQPALPRNMIINLLADSLNDVSSHFDKENNHFHLLYNDKIFLEYNDDDRNVTVNQYRLAPAPNLDYVNDVSIPETVWSLDVSTGAHLDHVSDDFGSEWGITLGKHRPRPDWWPKEILGLWTDESADKASGALLLSPPQFQVASCGGDSAVRQDLDRCSISQNGTNQFAGDGIKSTTQNDNDNSANNSVIASSTSNNPVVSSNSTSAPQEDQPDILHDLSLLMPSNVPSNVPQDDRSDVSGAPDNCDDISAACAIVQIDSPTAPFDSPIGPGEFPIASGAPTGSPAPLTPPGPVISIGDPAPVSDPPPIFIPPPAAASVPETSTWVMTMIGFAIMVLISRGKTMNSIMHGVVGAFFKIAKKSFRRYTA
jgi:hypothetical protein